MFLWIAIIGHLLNAAAFIIDKALLNRAFKNSLTYAVLIGALPTVTILAVPWVQRWPSGPGPWLATVAYGAFFIFALWGFFEALKHAEASRVVPVTGSLVPIFTLIGSSFLVGERLAEREYLGLAFLIAATWLLTRKKGTAAITRKVFALCVAAGFLFAASSVAGKYAFASADFLGVFIASRLVGVVISLALFALVTEARVEALSVLSGMRRDNASRHSAPPLASGVALLTLAGQSLGAVGFLLINYAVSLGSATLVNALQAVQYAVLVLVAWFGGVRINKILNEDTTRDVILKKSLAIVAVALGLALAL